MDRVLLVIDNRQFSSHLEYALRKVGYKTESLQSEHGMSEKVVSFNPDIILVKTGTGASKASTFGIAKKINEMPKYNGKVMLVFESGKVPVPELLGEMKYDLILEEPASALKIALNILNLDPSNREVMFEKLMKMAFDDVTFRDTEETYLVQYGVTFEQEVFNIQSNKLKNEKLEDIPVSLAQELNDPEYLAIQRKKIETYNRIIEKIDVDLKQGLQKRQTKTISKGDRTAWGIDDTLDADLDLQRKEFVKELFKKE